MGRKKAFTTISPKKVQSATKKKGSQFDDNNLTTLLYAIIFNQPEIVKDVLEIKKKIKDEVYPKGVAMNQDEVEFYHNEFKNQEA